MPSIFELEVAPGDEFGNEPGGGMLEKLKEVGKSPEDIEESDLPGPFYTVYGQDDKPIACHLEGCIDRWRVDEGGCITVETRVLVCEHPPILFARGGCRQISTVKIGDVKRVQIHPDEG